MVINCAILLFFSYSLTHKFNFLKGFIKDDGCLIVDTFNISNFMNIWTKTINDATSVLHHIYGWKYALNDFSFNFLVFDDTQVLKS